MVHTIITSGLAVILASLAVADGALKCYMCDTALNSGCDDPASNNLEPVECDNHNLQKWQSEFTSNRMLNNLASLFEVDIPKHHQQTMAPMFACAKVNYKVKQQDATFRTCQLAKTEYVDTCKVLKDKMSSMPEISFESCDLCDSDACNSSSILMPKMFLFILSFVGIMFTQAFYKFV